jgi:catechol 2,3-dioxygenase-like lactoylglutathione lyase family enzyme
MLGHIGLSVPDLVATRNYYGDLFPMVGFEEFLATEDRLAYRPADGKPGTFVFFYRARRTDPYDRDAIGLQHLAFMLKSRSAVRRVHAWAAGRGDTILDAPQDFPQYPPPYFATFWLDPHGFKLEAVCHHDRD